MFTSYGVLRFYQKSMSDAEAIYRSECDREACIFDKFREDFIETESWLVQRVQ